MYFLKQMLFFYDGRNVIVPIEGMELDKSTYQNRNIKYMKLY
jgi:hypothetical protein